jgi:hypothetical protein
MGSKPAAEAAAALDRLVGVVRCALALLEDARRPSADLLDTPVATLAYHRIAWRQLGGSGGSSASASARLLVGAQEVCSFDPSAAPEDEHAWPPPLDAPGATRCVRLASVHWRAAPAVTVVGARVSAARRLLGGGGGGDGGGGSGDVSAADAAAAAFLRIDLRGTSVAVLRTRRAGGGDGAAAAATAAAREEEEGEVEEEERHEITLPALHLSDPLRHEGGALALEGALRVRCAKSGLEARLDLARDGRIKGGALRGAPGMAEALRLRLGGASGGGGGAAGRSTVQVGTFCGRWDEGGEVVVDCPWLQPPPTPVAGGGGGVALPPPRGFALPVWRSSSSGGGSGKGKNTAAVRPPLRRVDLRALPPMQLARLWSAVADAAAYPSAVVGGGGASASAAAARLAAALSARAGGGLALGRPAPRDVAGEGRTAADEKCADPELEAFDRAADAAGGAKAGKAGAGGDDAAAAAGQAAAARSVAPCYNAEHVAGRRLAWQLRHELLRQEVVVPVAEADAAPPARAGRDARRIQRALARPALAPPNGSTPTQTDRQSRAVPPLLPPL